MVEGLNGEPWAKRGAGAPSDGACSKLPFVSSPLMRERVHQRGVETHSQWVRTEPGAVSSPADRFEPEPDLHPALQYRGAEKEVQKSTHAEVLKTSKGESHVEEAREGLLMLPCLSPPCVIHEADDSTQTGNQREAHGEGETLSVFLQPLHEADDSTHTGNQREVLGEGETLSVFLQPLHEAEDSTQTGTRERCLERGRHFRSSSNLYMKQRTAPRMGTRLGRCLSCDER